MSNKIGSNHPKATEYTAEQKQGVARQSVRITEAIINGGAELREKLIESLPKGTSLDLGAAAAGGTLDRLKKDRFFQVKAKNVVALIQNGSVKGTNDEVAGQIMPALTASAGLSRDLKEALQALNEHPTKKNALALFEGIRDGALAMGKKPEQLEVLAGSLERLAKTLDGLKQAGKTADKAAPLVAEALANQFALVSSALRTFVAGHLTQQPAIKDQI